MTIIGIVNKIQRFINQQLKKIGKKLSRHKKKEAEAEETEVPRSWLRSRGHSAAGRSKPVVLEDRGKKVIIRKGRVYRISWLKTLKRVLAAFLLFINFVISQFLLASQTEAAPAFIFFLANCFVLLDYLWKTRGS
jgi:hypothetical protein